MCFREQRVLQRPICHGIATCYRLNRVRERGIQQPYRKENWCRVNIVSGAPTDQSAYRSTSHLDIAMTHYDIPAGSLYPRDGFSALLNCWKWRTKTHKDTGQLLSR
jgi:hypothetical protein